MNIQTQKPKRAPIWLSADSGDFETFRQIVSQTTDPADTPLATEVVCNIPVYDGAMVDAAAQNQARCQTLMEEWAHVFAQGAGIIVIRQGVPDHGVIDRASMVFDQIIADEKRAAKGGGDHFAKPGANDRIWNSLEKHCLADPTNFAAYFASNSIALASKAWLGPAYQMTAQVNRVNPGGAGRTNPVRPVFGDGSTQRGHVHSTVRIGGHTAQGAIAQSHGRCPEAARWRVPAERSSSRAAHGAERGLPPSPCRPCHSR